VKFMCCSTRKPFTSTPECVQSSLIDWSESTVVARELGAGAGAGIGGGATVATSEAAPTLEPSSALTR
jgi:hypothetical protein